MPLQLTTGKISATSVYFLSQDVRHFTFTHPFIRLAVTFRCHVGTHCYPFQWWSDKYFSMHGPVSALRAIFRSYALSLWLYTPLAQLTLTASACSPQRPFSKMSLSPDFSTIGESSCDQCRFLSSSRPCQSSKCKCAFLRPCEGGWCLVEPPFRRRSSTPSDAQLLPVLINNNIQTMTLNGKIPSTLDRYSMLNWKDLFLYSECYVVGPEVDRADIEPLLRFVWRS